MKTLQLKQGTPGWYKFRAVHFNASEAPVMAASSKHSKRNELLAEKKTGIAKEFSDYTENVVFAKGHKAEAAIRPYIENIVGEDLFPSTGEKEIDGLPLAASFDGLTMDETLNWEQKSLNQALRDFFTAYELDNTVKIDPMYAIQMEQQMMVSGAIKTIFSASDGDPDDTLWFWYYPDPELQRQVIAGWHQFEKDLVDFVVPEEEAILEKKTIKELPALIVQVQGSVTTTNIDEFEETAIAFIDGVNIDLETDQDFADAEGMVKFFTNVETSLKTVKAQALAQTADIDKLFRTMDDISEKVRQKRLFLDKLVKSQKATIKADLMEAATNALVEHCNALNKEFDGNHFIQAYDYANFPEVMKGKRTITSIRSALDDELAQAKILSNDVAQVIRGNMKLLKEKAANFEFLFMDLDDLVGKPAEDFQSIVSNRIIKHEEEQAEIKKQADLAAANTETKAFSDEKPVKDFVGGVTGQENQDAIVETFRAKEATGEPDHVLLRRYINSVNEAVMADLALKDKKNITLFNRIQKKLLKPVDEMKDKLDLMEGQ